MSRFDSIAALQQHFQIKKPIASQQEYRQDASARPDFVDSISQMFGDPSIFQDCGDEVALYRNLLRDRVSLVEKGEDPSPKLFRACQRYVARFKKRVEILERRGGDGDEAHLRRQHWATKASFFFDRPFATKWSFMYFVLVTLVILYSCVAVILQSVPQFNPQLFEAYRVMWAQGDIFSSLLLLFDRFAQIFAGILDPEGGSNSVLKRMKKVLLRLSVIIDLLACIIPLILAVSSSPVQGSSVLDLFVLLRVYRILMSLRHFDPFEDLTDTLRSSAPALAAPLVGLFVILFGVSSIVYTFEGGTFQADSKQFLTKVDDCLMSAQYLKGRTECPRVESKFVSAVHTIWFTLITFLTVGYGDLVPLTQAGRLVAAMAIFIGMLFVAIPIAIVGSNFTETVERLRTERALVGQWMDRDKEAKTFAHKKLEVEREMAKAAPIPSLSFIRFMRMNMRKTVLNLRNPSRTARYLCELYLTRVVEVFKDPMHAETWKKIKERARTVSKRPYAAKLQLVDSTPQKFAPVPLMRPVSVTIGASSMCDITFSDDVVRKLRSGVLGAGGKPLIKIPNMIASRHAVVSLLPFAGTSETAKIDPVQPFSAWMSPLTTKKLIASSNSTSSPHHHHHHHRKTWTYENEETTIYLSKPPTGSSSSTSNSMNSNNNSKDKKSSSHIADDSKKSSHPAAASRWDSLKKYSFQQKHQDEHDDDNEEGGKDKDDDDGRENEEADSDYVGSDDEGEGIIRSSREKFGSSYQLGASIGVPFGINLEYGKQFSIVHMDQASSSPLGNSLRPSASFLIPKQQ